MYKVPIASPVLEKKIIFLTLVIDDKEHLMKGLLESGRRNGGERLGSSPDTIRIGRDVVKGQIRCL